MIKLYNKDTNELLGRVSEEDLKFLQDQLEEESRKDDDYYITRQTVDEFEKKGAPSALVDLLRGGLRSGNAVEIYWKRDEAS